MLKRYNVVDEGTGVLVGNFATQQEAVAWCKQRIEREQDQNLAFIIQEVDREGRN